jgi:DNA helicase-2/ATP-dependent DNA helicase PcrA
LHIAKRSGIVHQLYSDKQKDGNYNEGTERYENVQELLNGIHAFSEENEDPDTTLTLRNYLSENIELLTDADNEEDDNNKVSLMTIHAAKGLEFKHVHVVGMEENLFPSQRSMDSRADMEEERRLFYVALTRACETCTLSYATMRFKWGQLHMGEPSRFLDEIDEQYLLHTALKDDPKKAYGSGGGFTSGGWSTKAMPSARPKPKLKLKDRPKSDYKPSIGGRKLKKISSASNGKSSTPPVNSVSSVITSSISEGMSVGHAKFGKGVVVKIEGDSPNVKATIKFPAVGTKQLLLKFAKLEIIS